MPDPGGQVADLPVRHPVDAPHRHPTGTPQVVADPSAWQAGATMEHPSGLAVTEHVPPTRRRGDPVVVLVHGSLDRGGSFARVVRRLDDLHVVTYDRRGYQGSRHLPPARGFGDHVDDLLAVVGDRPAVVVGHSYGADIALAGAAAPGSTIEAVAAYEPPLPWLGFWTRPSVGGGGPSDDDPAAAAERFFRRVVGPDAWERLSDAAREERRADGPALVTELQALRSGGPVVDPAALSVPVLYGRGERSRHHHRRGVAWLAGHTPDATVVEFPGASHGAHLTHPDAFADFVRQAVLRASGAAPAQEVPA